MSGDDNIYKQEFAQSTWQDDDSIIITIVIAMAKGGWQRERGVLSRYTHSISMIEMFTGAKVVSVNRGIRGSFWIDVVSLACDV